VEATQATARSLAGAAGALGDSAPSLSAFVEPRSAHTSLPSSRRSSRVMRETLVVVKTNVASRERTKAHAAPREKRALTNAHQHRPASEPEHERSAPAGPVSRTWCAEVA